MQDGASCFVELKANVPFFVFGGGDESLGFHIEPEKLDFAKPYPLISII